MIQIPFHCCTFAVVSVCVCVCLWNWLIGDMDTVRRPKHNQQHWYKKSSTLLQRRNLKLRYENLANKLQKSGRNWWIAAIKRSIRAVAIINERASQEKVYRLIWFFVALLWPVDVVVFFLDFLKLYTFRIFDLYKCICIGISLLDCCMLCVAARTCCACEMRSITKIW